MGESVLMLLSGTKIKKTAYHFMQELKMKIKMERGYTLIWRI